MSHVPTKEFDTLIVDIVVGADDGYPIVLQDYYGNIIELSWELWDTIKEHIDNSRPKETSSDKG